MSILTSSECSRCGGRGIIPEYRHIEAGVCFRCSGSGVEKTSAPRAPEPGAATAMLAIEGWCARALDIPHAGVADAVLKGIAKLTAAGFYIVDIELDSADGVFVFARHPAHAMFAEVHVCPATGSGIEMTKQWVPADRVVPDGAVVS